MKKLIKFAFIGAISSLATISHADGLYSDEKVNSAIQCMINKIKPADYQTFINGGVYSRPLGTVGYNSQGQLVCEHRYTDEYRSTASEAASNYRKELFAMCNASDMARIISYKVHIESTVSNKLVDKDVAFKNALRAGMANAELCK